MKILAATVLALALAVTCRAQPSVTVGVVETDDPINDPMVRMAPHACFAYINTSASTLGAGGWHECDISWAVTYANDDEIHVKDAIILADPRPQATIANARELSDTRYGQKGFVCWFLFLNAGEYKFTATVTNKDGNSGSGSATVTVDSDTREKEDGTQTERYYFVDSVAGDDDLGDGTRLLPYRTWDRATAAIDNDGLNSGILLKSGQVFPVAYSWSPTGIKNVRVDVYDGLAPATLEKHGIPPDLIPPGDAPVDYDPIIFPLQDCENILVRNINFSCPIPRIQVNGVAAGKRCKSISVVNSLGVQMLNHCGGVSDANTTSDGFAVVNCTTDNPAVMSVFTDGFYDVVVLGHKVINNQYSHNIRIGADPACVSRASVGYCDADTNYTLERPSDHHPLKTYLPYTYAYYNYFHNGAVTVGDVDNDAGLLNNHPRRSIPRVFRAVTANDPTSRVSLGPAPRSTRLWREGHGRCLRGRPS